MLPVGAGKSATTGQILVYIVLLVPISLLPWGTRLCRHNLRGDRRYLPGVLRFCSHSGCTGAAIPIAAMLPTCDFLLDLAIFGPLGRPSRRPLLRLRPRHSNV